MSKRSISVRVRGRELRVRSDEDEESLHRVADYLDQTMKRVEEKTGAVDTLGVAMVTALNLAREVVELREGRPAGGLGGNPERLQRLIELAESALESASASA